MDIVSVLWDLDDEPEGNVQHIAEHGLSKDEVESVLFNPDNEVDERQSSGRPRDVWLDEHGPSYHRGLGKRSR